MSNYDTTMKKETKNKTVDESVVLRHVKSDLAQAKSTKDQISKHIIDWRNIYDAKPYGNEVDGRSSIVMPEARNAVDWFVPNALKPFMAGKVHANPISSNDVEQADKVTKLLNYQYDRKFPKMHFLRKSLKTMAIEGTVVARTGWDFTEEEVAREKLTGLTPEFVTQLAESVEQSGGTIEKVKIDEDDGSISLEVVKHKILTNNPTTEIIKNEDFYIDPQAQNLADARFCIQAIDYTLSDLRKLDKKYSDEGIYEGVDDLKLENEKDTSTLGAYRDTMNLADYSAKDTDLEDDPRKRITVYEYYGEYDLDGDGLTEAIVCTFAGDTILRLAPNPFPDKKPPFIYCPYREDAFAFWGHSMVDLVAPHQKLKTAMMRTFIDMMASSTNGVKVVPKGSLDALNMRKLREAKIGDVIEVNPASSMLPQLLQQTQIPTSMMEFFQLLDQEKENSSGMTKYNQGGDSGSLNKTATGITAIMQQAQVRMWEVTEMFSDLYLTQMFKKWMSYNKAYLSDKTIIRIDDNDIPLSRDDIDGDFDLDINVSMVGVNEAKTQQITQLLQVAAPMVQSGAITPDIVQRLIAKLFEAMDFKDIAKELNERADQQSGQQSGNGIPPQSGGAIQGLQDPSAGQQIPADNQQPLY